MKFLIFLCSFMFIGVCVEGRFLSDQIGNSLPALNYRTHCPVVREENCPTFLTSNKCTPRRRQQPCANTEASHDIRRARISRSIESDLRGGSAAAANVARTMTARRMESLK